MLAKLGMGYLPDLSFSAECPPNSVWMPQDRAVKSDFTACTVVVWPLLYFYIFFHVLTLYIAGNFFCSHSLVLFIYLFYFFCRYAGYTPNVNFVLRHHLHSGRLNKTKYIYFFTWKKNRHYLVLIRLNWGEMSTEQMKGWVV